PLPLRRDDMDVFVSFGDRAIGRRRARPAILDFDPADQMRKYIRRGDNPIRNADVEIAVERDAVVAAFDVPPGAAPAAPEDDVEAVLVTVRASGARIGNDLERLADEIVAA